MEYRNQSESSCVFTTKKSLLEGLALVFFIVLSLPEMTSYSYESSVFSAELLSISLSFRVVIEIGGPSAASSRPSLSLSLFFWWVLSFQSPLRSLSLHWMFVCVAVNMLRVVRLIATLVSEGSGFCGHKPALTGWVINTVRQTSDWARHHNSYFFFFRTFFLFP